MLGAWLTLALTAHAEGVLLKVPAILQGLRNAPVKKLLMVDGGAGRVGEVCAALHWHGYIGMEREAVDLITGWIQHPTE